jgi:hypothetical protein
MNDGVTCGTCLTLNPPGVPACVRCNSPLAAPATTPPRAAAPVPPSRPPAPARPAPISATRRAGAGGDRLSALTPAVQRRILRRIQILGAIVLLLVLAVGGWVVWDHRPRTIDTAAVARTVEQQLGQQLGQQVYLTCPPDAARTRGTTFTCQAVDAAGATRTVVITVTGDDGSYQWQLR